MTKAAVLTNYDSPLELWEIDWEPLSFGQVRIQMLAAGICGAQLQEIRGEKGNHLPRLMGHEGCGIVREIGPGVKTVRVDDKVVLHWRKGDGIESENPQWRYRDAQATAGLVTVFSQHTVVSENRCTMVPRTTPVALCALLGCSLSTALGVLENDAKLKIGEEILIIGCGGLGSALMTTAPLFHPSRIIGVDREPKALTFNGHYGFTFGQWEKQIHSTFDVVIDTTGDSCALEAAVERLNPSGRLIMVGQPRGGFTVKGGRKLFDGDGFSVKATQGGGFRPAMDIPRYITLGRDFSEIVTHRFPLEGINDAIEVVKKGGAGRVLIEM
jgi:S-(hydroxymethyl)glutathione dehydrogenase / alcohol dehydrogenase